MKVLSFIEFYNLPIEDKRNYLIAGHLIQGGEEFNESCYNDVYHRYVSVGFSLEVLDYDH